MTIKIELSHLGWGIWAQRDRFLMGGTHSFYCTEQKHRGQFLFFLQLQCFCCIFAQITISCIPYYYYFKKTMWFLSCYYIQQPEKCWKKKKRISQFIHPSLLITLKYWGYVLPQRTVHYLNGLLFESDFDAQPAINAKCFSKILLSFGKWHLLLKVISDSYSQYHTFTSHFFNFFFICKHLYSSEILHLLKAIKNNSWISIWSSITPTRHHWIRIYPFPTAWYIGPWQQRYSLILLFASTTIKNFFNDQCFTTSE